MFYGFIENSLKLLLLYHDIICMSYVNKVYSLYCLTLNISIKIVSITFLQYIIINFINMVSTQLNI